MCFQVWQSVSVLTWERKRKRSQEWWGAAPTRFRRPCEWILERNETVRSFYRHQKPTCQSQEESIIYQDELFCCWRHRSHPGRRCQSPLSCTSWRLGCGTIRCFRWAKCHQGMGVWNTELLLSIQVSWIMTARWWLRLFFGKTFRCSAQAKYDIEHYRESARTGSKLQRLLVRQSLWLSVR